MRRRFLVQEAPFESWMAAVLQERGFDAEESRETSKWASQTAQYEVETHGARKIFSLLEHEFARSGSCVPSVQHQVLLSTGSLEVWDGKKKLGPAVSKLAQSRSVEMARQGGMGIVCVRECNHVREFTALPPHPCTFPLRLHMLPNTRAYS
jgi:LDH2 family malate/lactate/ureidoglycolate dehydrogenase